ncbi:hypothetical protein VSR01_02530 [Actinacidiphila sp. DG2A-62]|uniref:class III lanthionine synthetase LanKC N-terminal domain-containing protein n=1 Tax=Actinacidiphila sp. DG2A-62 TaxID=3108821 RepID=UPI002DB6136E|nr:hypothetical protein [Actinacidiphila sp. DG2A-62]MEC3992480.1 hypothetical protein [Actinacidiphila sp. DG2A-62]
MAEFSLSGVVRAVLDRAAADATTNGPAAGGPAPGGTVRTGGPAADTVRTGGVADAVVRTGEHRTWSMRTGETWCHVEPSDAPRRRQGWKLHVSATRLSFPEVLHRTAEVLVDAGCAFKFARSLDLVQEMTSHRYDRAQCGKVITVYPADDARLAALAQALDEATAGLPGPAVLSDRPWRPGSLVHLRYGAFDGTPVLTNEGSFEVMLRDPAGRAVRDARKPWFTPPAWPACRCRPPGARRRQRRTRATPRGPPAAEQRPGTFRAAPPDGPPCGSPTGTPSARRSGTPRAAASSARSTTAPERA